MKQLSTFLVLTLLSLLLSDCSRKDIPRPNPKASFIWANSGEGTIQFTDQSTEADTYNWNFGDNSTTSSEKSPRHTFPSNGSFSIQLTVKNPTGTDQLTKAIDVSSFLAPVASFSVSLGNDGLVNFVNTTTKANIYQWDFGNGTASSEISPSVKYTENKKYTVSLTAVGQGGQTKVSQEVTVTSIKPSVDYSWTESNGLVSFVNKTSNAESYEWDFGNGQNSTDINPTIQYQRGGTYTISLTATGKGGQVIKMFTITFNSANATNSIHLTLGDLSDKTNGTTITPSIDKADDYLLVKDQYTISYNKSRGQANWVAWHLQKSDFGSIERKDDFRPDGALPIGWYQVKPTDYSSVDGFDRGHLCPSADRTDAQVNNSATFLMTNIIPQAPALNRGAWANFEEYCRELVWEGNELYIYSGAYGTQGTGSNGAKSVLASGKVVVPARIWKLVVVLPQGDNDASRINNQTIVISIDWPNTQLSEDKDWDDYLVSPSSIESAANINFLSKLPQSLRSSLRTKTYKPVRTD
ncbi:MULTISPECIES: DNA/RNA non-specific endonuclease [unclassified Spirosoma]|uniref:DNA/RNA non-specific endonuclease n=1 Tax=unclassified Spirosoma TaxID=2621999 RepID=UPI000963E314|nr:MULTISPECIES: DNA/RNA non-specific endonuclease [unclassified Spirosoma]MBN8825489.1 DNA/RNA non-specific endonuclease [Spirosoma sp.]OJW74257.1 MAG: hypothetical protein BGO59_14175 [Spirosoma sp. 48-14]